LRRRSRRANGGWALGAGAEPGEAEPAAVDETPAVVAPAAPAGDEGDPEAEFWLGRRRQRRKRDETQTLFLGKAIDGAAVRVIQKGRERRLVIRGQTQSVYFTDGDWSAARRDYWTRAVLDAPPFPPRPRVLMVGLGGGTQVHVLRAHVRPRLITVIERDPVVLRVAARWFGLDQADRLEFLHGDAALAIEHLQRIRRRFDFVMDDISYAAPRAEAIETARALAVLLASRGVLALNQHSRADAREVARALEDLLPWVEVRRVVTPTAENILIFAARCRPAADPPS
jgi:spermidine synthase